MPELEMDCTWEVPKSLATGFYLKDDGSIAMLPGNKATCIYATNNESREYKVIKEVPDFFLRFGEIADPDNKAHRVFASRYGFLTGYAQKRRIYREGGESYQTFSIEEFAFWRKEQQQAAFVLMAWDAIQRSNTELLEKLIYKKTDEIWVRFAEPQVFKEYSLEDFRNAGRNALDVRMYDPAIISCPNLGSFKYDEQDFAGPLRQGLAIIVNKKLWEYHLYFQLIGYANEDPISYYPYIKPENLLAAIWYQFYRVLSGQINIRKCTECEKWEFIGYHDGIRGKNENWQAHLACGNNKRQAKSRKGKDDTEKRAQKNWENWMAKPLAWRQMKLKNAGLDGIIPPDMAWGDFFPRLSAADQTRTLGMFVRRRGGKNK